MIRRTSNAFITIAGTLALTACSASFSIGQQTAQTDDCDGKEGKCSVAEHEARQPVIAGDLDARIHDYLLVHPEVVAEAQRGLAVKQAAERQAQAKAALAANRDATFFDPADPVIGNPKGDITLVIFTDYECPFCKKVTPEIDRLIAADSGVRVVVKEFPILGPVSETAARYALAAKAQGKYAGFHAALMASTVVEHELTEAQILDFAKASGLDIERLKKDAADPAIAATIVANRALAQKLGVSGTPGLMITGAAPDSAQIVNIRDLQGFQQAVNAARASKVASAQ